MGYGPEDFIESAVLWICRNWARQQARSWTLEQKICHKKSTVSDLSATVDFNLIHPLDYPPYSLLIYLKLLSQIVILYFISFYYPIGISFFRFFVYLFLDFNLSSHWNLPLSIYLFDDLMNYPIGFYLSLFKYRFRFLNYSFWWSVPLSLDF